MTPSLRNSAEISTGRPAIAPALERVRRLHLALLLLTGAIVICAALAFRSSRWSRERLLQTKPLTDLEEIVRQSPNDSLAQYYLAKQYYLARRFGDARTAYEASTAVEPDN